MPFPAWILTVGGLVARLWRRRDAAAVVFDQAQELVGEVEALIHDDPPPQPLTHKDVAHIQSQIASATAHKVPPTHQQTLVYTQTGPDPTRDHCRRPPEGWWCTREPFHGGPCAAYPIGEGPTAVALEPVAAAGEPHPGLVKAADTRTRGHADTDGAGDVAAPRTKPRARPPRPLPPMKGEKK